MILRSLKYRILSRISEPYRIRNGFGLSPIRNKRELKALIRFCESQLKEIHIQELNPKKKEVLETTIELYQAELDQLPIIRDKWSYVNIHEYIRDNIGYYWS